jgi:hypothetical protein
MPAELTTMSSPDRDRVIGVGDQTSDTPRRYSRGRRCSYFASPETAVLDQPAFNRNRLKAEKLIDPKVLEQLISVQMDAR